MTLLRRWLRYRKRLAALTADHNAQGYRLSPAAYHACRLKARRETGIGIHRRPAW